MWSKKSQLGIWVHHALFLLKPGLDLKRWIVLILLGVTFLILGVAFTVQVTLSDRVLAVLRIISLNQFPPLLRGSIFLISSLVIMGVSGWRLYLSLSNLRRQRPLGTNLLNELYVQRILGSGPNMVALGGGTGLSTLLSGLKLFTNNVSAIVTVSDDGGSSGRLRKELGILPPGDIRNCLVALADSEEIMQRLMEHRFESTGSLEGHSFGNLLIAALANITGNFESGVAMAGQILAIRGQVLPSTLSNVTLTGKTLSGRTLLGESEVGKAGEPLSSLTLAPSPAESFPPTLDAIAKADLILIGPGSLYTSVVPNLLVPSIREALHKAPGLKVYICNVAEQPGETDGFTVDDYIEIILRYGGPQSIDVVVANKLVPQNIIGGPTLISPRTTRTAPHPPILWADVLDTQRPTRHDTTKLVKFLLDLYHKNRRTPIS